MSAWSRKLCLVASILSVLIISACGSTSSPTTGGGTSSGGKTQIKIMVGGISKQIYLPNMLTKQLGYFDEQGLDVTLIDEVSGQSSENEVLAGQVDGGSGSYNHTIELQAQAKIWSAWFS